MYNFGLVPIYDSLQENSGTTGASKFAISLARLSY